MSYGIQPTGYVRKPLSVILAELEAGMISEFGPGVIQTPQSPLGQLNGLMADLIAEIDEVNLDLYQSYDPDQAEGNRLETLARLRLINRGFMDDTALRQAVTNSGQGRVDLQDLARAVSSISGVSYSKVFVNDSGETENPELERGFVAVAVIGGDDSEIADVIRRYVVPGVSTYGNTRVTSDAGGLCRSISIIRPIEVPVDVVLTVRLFKDQANCPPPSQVAIVQTLEQVWMERRVNGMDVSAYQLRSIVESTFSNVEVLTFVGARGGVTGPTNQPVSIGFTEIASVNVELVVQ